MNDWTKDALWGITKSDVKALTEGRNLTDEQLEMLYHHIEKMDASLIMEQVSDLIDWTLAETN